jgi:hypothetical protein
MTDDWLPVIPSTDSNNMVQAECFGPFRQRHNLPCHVNLGTTPFLAGKTNVKLEAIMQVAITTLGCWKL